MAEHHVIVGGGQAAFQAAQTLRQAAPHAAITLVGNESELPYQRPPLSKKYLAGALPRERLLLRPAAFYTERAIALELGCEVVEIDRAAQRIRLADGRRIGYDRLLLTTGSRPRPLEVPGAELANVHYLRTVADVDRIRSSLAHARRVVLIGAGYIGLEAAAVLVELGLEVTVLEASRGPLGRVVCAEIAQFYHDYHTHAGVQLAYEARVTALMGGERVTTVVDAENHTYPCDVAIIGIGVVPNVELAQAADLACDDGILVDGRGGTSDAAIFAAGDCANQHDGHSGRRVRLESVPNAVQQAKIAAHGMLGMPPPRPEVPWFWSEQYDLKLQIVGLAGGHERVVLRGEPSAKGFAAYYLAGCHVLAVEAVNSPRDFAAAKKLIAERAPVDPATVADPNADLMGLVRTDR